MSYFEKTLDQRQFVRTHRSYIINVQHIPALIPTKKKIILPFSIQVGKFP